MTTDPTREHGTGTIEARGPAKWLVRLSYGVDSLTGKRVREAVTVTGPRRDAERVLRRLLAAKDGGQGPRRERSRLTVGAWMDQFVVTDPAATPATRRRMQQSWKLYASARLRVTPLRDCSAALLTDELARLRAQVSPRTGKPLAGRTVGIFFAILRAGLSHAVEQGLIATNPAARLKRPTDETKSPQAPHLTVEEVRQLLEVSNADPLAPFWRIMVEAGLRPAEGLALRWPDVDLVGGTVTVRHALVHTGERLEVAPPKTHQVRTVAISEGTVEAVRRHQTEQKRAKLLHGARYQDQGLVFPDAIGRPVHPFAASKAFKRLARAAGLPADVRLYSLRHTAATHALADGLDVRTVSEQLGHASPALTLSVYAHAAPLDRQRASTERRAARYRAAAPAQRTAEPHAG